MKGEQVIYATVGMVGAFLAGASVGTNMSFNAEAMDLWGNAGGVALLWAGYKLYKS